jgi:hypothetical protein
MNADLLLVLGALIACVGLFIINKPRMDVVALLVIVILPLTGIISMPEALAGFSDTNVVLIAALFVIGEGLTRTGVAYRLSDHLIGMSGTSEARLLVLLMLARFPPFELSEFVSKYSFLPPATAATLNCATICAPSAQRLRNNMRIKCKAATPSGSPDALLFNEAIGFVNHNSTYAHRPKRNEQEGRLSRRL